MKRVTRIVSQEDAKMFVQNMRWFAGVGRIKVELLSGGKAAVTARPDTFSHFNFTKEEVAK